ncbi:olfactory receptor 4E2-like [Trichomycterus rosablanca]|uniref:olfactory receptor 4E2-like n=1 Tax=Trichomycterus rosablanca TaxID=2290929 RepID=UPI002F34F90C
MMENSSREISFVLNGLDDTWTNRQIYFALGLAAYILILFLNGTLAITIILDKTLHEPMFLFLCNLFISAVCGTSAFYPKILTNIVTDTYVISYTGCLSQMFIMYCYIFCDFTCLTVMSYDRYVAICKPLEYHSIMTLQKGVKLLIFIWFTTVLETSIGTYLTARLQLCSNKIDKPYCSNWEVVKLACTDVTVNNVYGYCLIFYHTFQSIFVVISYVLIIRASLHSKTGRVKFMQTCLPHLLSLLTFTVSLVFDAMYSRYGNKQGHQTLHNILGMEFIIVSPLLNPIIYGIKLTQIRHGFVKLYRQRVKALLLEFVIVPPILNPIIYGIKLTQIRHGFVKLYRQRVYHTLDISKCKKFLMQ